MKILQLLEFKKWVEIINHSRINNNKMKQNMEWIKINEDGSNIPLDKRLVVRYEYKVLFPERIKQGWGVAKYLPKYSDTNPDENWDTCDLDEKDGEYYLPEGWYEEYQQEDKIMAMSATVTHFMEIDISQFK